MDDKWGGHKPAAMRLAPAESGAGDAGTAAAVTAQPEPARCITSLHFRRLSAAGCAAGGRNCRSRPADGPLLQCYLGCYRKPVLASWNDKYTVGSGTIHAGVL